jgi:hypothetical protein
MSMLRQSMRLMCGAATDQNHSTEPLYRAMKDLCASWQLIVVTMGAHLELRSEALLYGLQVLCNVRNIQQVIKVHA